MTDSRSQGRAAFRLRGPLHWRCLDGEWLVCSVNTASISQLDDWSAAALGLIEAGPVSHDALLAALSEAVGMPSATADASAVAAQLDTALRYLQQQDLVTRTA